MAIEKANGNLPMNARINIRYNKNKPKISFSYPDKDSQQRGSMFYPVRTGCLFFGMISSIMAYYLGILLKVFPIESAVVGMIVWVGLIYYLFPIIIYFPFKKKWDKLYPRYTGFMAKKKLRIFYPKDIQEENERYFVELPVFSNIICDFKCKGEFSDYLNEVDIREHKFTSIKLSKIKRKKKKKRKVNEFLWYARWYFDKKPKTGKMEVIFK